MMRKGILLLSSMAFAVLIVSGVALAIVKTCDPGTTSTEPCQGTNFGDSLTGTEGADHIEGLPNSGEFDEIDGLGGGQLSVWRRITSSDT